jgi:hypothetical protein
MLKHSLLVAAGLALGASTAAACSYQNTVQSPVPPVAAAPAQTPVPTEPVKQDVASAETQKADVPKTN